jgi:hypothetical protein
MTMTLKQRERWTRVRTLGRKNFIWKYGVLGWGVPVAVVWATVMAAWNGWGQLPILLPLALVAFPAGGYVLGALMWRQSEIAFDAPS